MLHLTKSTGNTLEIFQIECIFLEEREFQSKISVLWISLPFASSTNDTSTWFGISPELTEWLPLKCIAIRPLNSGRYPIRPLVWILLGCQSDFVPSPPPQWCTTKYRKGGGSAPIAFCVAIRMNLFCGVKKKPAAATNAVAETCLVWSVDWEKEANLRRCGTHLFCRALCRHPWIRMLSAVE